jgi:hypothetical protein
MSRQRKETKIDDFLNSEHEIEMSKLIKGASNRILILFFLQSGVSWLD